MAFFDGIILRKKGGIIVDADDIKEFKKYKKIFKKKSNYGYCEWSEEIKKKLYEMTEEELINRFKKNQTRYEEIRLVYNKDDDLPYINNVIMVAVSITSVLFSVFAVWADVLKDYEINTADYFPDTIEALSSAITMSNQLFVSLASIGIWIAVIIFMAIFVLWMVNKKGNKIIVKEITYYEEMNELMKKELARRNMLLNFL